MSKKDNEYWNTFYSKKKLIKKPSSFAFEIVKYLDSDKKLLELGCGNGRDSFFFAKNGIHVIALDLSNQVIDIDRDSSEDGNIQFLTPVKQGNFFLHITLVVGEMIGSNLCSTPRHN